jgi:hypothetical protein
MTTISEIQSLGKVQWQEKGTGRIANVMVHGIGKMVAGRRLIRMTVGVNAGKVVAKCDPGMGFKAVFAEATEDECGSTPVKFMAIKMEAIINEVLRDSGKVTAIS